MHYKFYFKVVLNMINKQETITYGGEIEVLAINANTQETARVSQEFLGKVEGKLIKRDVHDKPSNMGYDSSQHLLEIGLGVHSTLISDVEAAKEAVTQLQKDLNEEGRAIVSTSYHPIENPATAYKRVLPKPIYELIRGTYGESHIHPTVLEKTYPINPELGRGWTHEAGTLAAAIQPWNSLNVESASEQIAVLQATGFMFNLLLANSPYANGESTGMRDYRLEMWGENGLTASSRYKTDALLTENLPSKPKGLAEYYKYVFGNQRPLVIPYRKKQDVKGTEYKTSFMSVVQPPDNAEFSILDYLKSPSVLTVDIETGETIEVKPSVAHTINGFDFLYFPRFGARLRLSLPEADSIDPVLFAEAIESADEKTFRELLEKGGINNGGFICAEGRVSASVLPTADHNDWKRMAMPFVLQTALVRGYDRVWNILESSGLSWNELTSRIPTLTNSQSNGFETQVGGVKVVELAQRIWNDVQDTLSQSERDLVGDEIDLILSTHIAPAEEQIMFIEKTLELSPSMNAALLSLLEHLHALIPTR